MGAPALLAGALAGAAAGAASSGISGGKIWEGILIGTIAGAVGGQVGSMAAKGAEFAAGALAGGATAGAISTALHGGNFFKNFVFGGLEALMTAGLMQGAAAVFKNTFGVEDILATHLNTEPTRYANLSVITFTSPDGTEVLCDACVDSATDATTEVSAKGRAEAIKAALKWMLDWKKEGESAGFKYGNGRYWSIVHKPTGLQIRVDYHPMSGGQSSPPEWHFHIGGHGENNSLRFRIPESLRPGKP